MWRLLYTLSFYLALPFLLLRLGFLGWRHRGYWRRLPERFGFAPYSPPGAITLWIHAVSVGEFLAALPLINALQSKYPNHRILITTMTPTGADMVRQKLGGVVTHAYMPFDVPGAVARFLVRTRPALCVLMETELWPNLLAACAGRRVPVLLANARLSAISARGYARFASLTHAMLSAVTAAAQTVEDAVRLQTLGAAQITVTGNLKYDQPLDPDAIKLGREWRERNAAARPVWIAASTHAGEEEIVLAAHGQIRRRYPDCLLILVPRHSNRAAAVTTIAERRGFRVQRHSRSEESGDSAVHVVDVLGRLILFYAAADVAFVGGSLVPTGGHNLLEPAALGLPVLCGPYAFNFVEARHLLKEAGGLESVTDATMLAQAVMRLLSDPLARRVRGRAAAAVVEANRGATNRIMSIIAKMGIV
ncbi:MAG TPA: lipid IV(A) 3-deoxy-D-manno-octulosonic acid transferase [Gammaproteobacteria bacterium]|nr:lipid IV(A) 3-deoxy-D-manno-octulosonic acid transferase [Gammaproteobacteria bacterium]